MKKTSTWTAIQCYAAAFALIVFAGMATSLHADETGIVHTRPVTTDVLPMTPADSPAPELSPGDPEAESAASESLAPPASGASSINAPEFSNACQPPRWKRVRVPKNKDALSHQLGDTFQVVRRGKYLIAGDLEAPEFDHIVNGVFACCKLCLEKDFFTKPTDEVVTIYLFRDFDRYRDGLRAHFGMDPISPYGHYGHRQRYIVINYDTGPGTLVHELTHAMMAPDFPDAPIWISEGIASLYEQCRVEGESLRGEDNWRLPELIKAVEEDRLTPLPILFSFSSREFRLSEESLHYAQSRYFCKYLEEHGLLRDLYREFRDTVENDPTGVNAVETILKRPIERIQDEWIDWLREQTWKPLSSGSAP